MRTITQEFSKKICNIINMVPSVEGLMVDYHTSTKIPPDTKVENNYLFYPEGDIFFRVLKIGWGHRLSLIELTIIHMTTSVSQGLNIAFIMCKIIVFLIIMLFGRLHASVGILLSCRKHLHELIISLRGLCVLINPV